MLAIDKDEIEVELTQKVDHPRRREGKVVAECLAASAHRGFDSVGLLHQTLHLYEPDQRFSDPIGDWVVESSLHPPLLQPAA